jgi:hypothetical protein
VHKKQAKPVPGTNTPARENVERGGLPEAHNPVENRENAYRMHTTFRKELMEKRFSRRNI